jgi:hypothetical protein
MGKKSRRQRTKKVLNLDPKGAPPAAITPHGNLAPEQLRVFGNELLDSQKYWTHDDERGPCRLIDALQRGLQRRDAGPFYCRCAVPAVRCDVDEPGHNSDGRVLAARLVDDTAEVDVLVPPWANLEPSAAGVASLRAQDIQGGRYLVLDSYDEAEEPYEDAFSQDVAADLYGATQVEE